MLTGQSPMRYGLNFIWGNKPEGVTGDYYVGERALPAEDPTLAAGLKAEGYNTFFVGKWHLGMKNLPGTAGFDRFNVQIPNDPASPTYRSFTERGPATVTSEWQSKHAADQIISFMDEELAAGENVFVNWWPAEPHSAYSASQGEFYYVPRTFDRAAFDRDAGSRSIDLSTDRGKMLSMLYSFDAQLGRVLDYIKQKNLYDDALIVITSDNGGHRGVLSPTRELQEAKGSTFEGGLRVPFTASWPKRFAAGTHTSAALSAFDVFPTLLGLIGGTIPAGIEGRNMASILLNGSGNRGPLFFQVRLAQSREREDETFADRFALVDGCDKLVIWQSREHLYDLCKDPNERTNLAGSNPARLASLRTALRDHRVRITQLFGANSLTSAVALPHSERLDIHHDDLSFYATVNAGTTGSSNLYRRGDGVNLRIENGSVVAAVTGTADATIRPALRMVTLDAPIPADGKSHRVGFVIRGYIAGGSTISLYVDGQLKSRVAAPLKVTQNPGPSILAVKSEVAGAEIGAAGQTLSNVLLLASAIEPDEF